MSRTSVLIRPHTLIAEEMNDGRAESETILGLTQNTGLMTVIQSVYEVDQQMKFINLKAEVESLLSEMERLKAERLSGNN